MSKPSKNVPFFSNKFHNDDVLLFNRIRERERGEKAISASYFCDDCTNFKLKSHFLCVQPTHTLWVERFVQRVRDENPSWFFSCLFAYVIKIDVCFSNYLR